VIISSSKIYTNVERKKGRRGYGLGTGMVIYLIILKFSLLAQQYTAMGITCNIKTTMPQLSKFPLFPDPNLSCEKFP
jgi:hypothetical protein